MLVHPCSAHSVNIVNLRLKKLYPDDKSKIHLGLRIYGRLISSTKVGEYTEFVKQVYHLPISPSINDSVQQACTFVQDSINTFWKSNIETIEKSQAKHDTESDIEEMSFTDDDGESTDSEKL